MSTHEHDIMSERFDDWLRRCLIEANERLPPEVERRILEQGTGVIAPLIQILEDRALLPADAPGNGWAPIHAAVLLGKLHAANAIPALLAALADDECRYLFADEAVQSLTAMGPAALEPVLRAHADASNFYHLMDLESILCSLGVRDERVFTTLLGTLERDPQHGAACLAFYGDERAIEPLRRAFDRPDLEAHSWLDGQAAEEIRAALQTLGGSLTEEQERTYQRARARLQARMGQRPERHPAATKAAKKRRNARKQQKASRKKNRR